MIKPFSPIQAIDDWNDIQSKSMDLLRFPLAVAVIFLHYASTQFYGATGALKVLCIVFQEGICRIAVPCFFFISGYLFFCNLAKWDWVIWKRKLRRRIQTLFIPYFLWIIIALLVYWLFDLYQGNQVSLIQYFINRGGLRIFWSETGGFPVGSRALPINIPLWFVRDLIYYIVITPVLHYYITHTQTKGIIAVLVTFLLVRGIIPEGFVFFLLGAYFSINKKNFAEYTWQKRMVLYCLFALLFFANYFFFNIDYWGRIVGAFFRLVGVGTSFCVASELVIRHTVKPNMFLVRSSFFIYAAHEILILRRLAIPLVLSVFPSVGQGWAFLRFFLTPAVCVTICLVLFYVMGHVMPRTTSILTGNHGRLSA